jgi:small subunit ribosomal protein S17e
LCFNGV